MTRTKYIENKNITWDLTFKSNPEFCINKIIPNEGNLLLHYKVEGRGFSIYSEDHYEFSQLPSKIEIISGGWYGDKGRWSPLERYVGTILCENVFSQKKLSENGKDYRFEVSKKWYSSQKKLSIESNNVGIVEIKCQSIIPQDFQIFLYSKIQKNGFYENRYQFKRSLLT
jgi:hypothetical protein